MWQLQRGIYSRNQALAPAPGGGSLNYDFTTGSLPSGVSGAGGANGTRTNSSDVIVAATAPRFDYLSAASLGVLVEEARTNLMLNSGNAAAWLSYITTPTANAATAPDGTTTATSITYPGGQSAQYQNLTLSAVTYTGSMWVKTSSGTAGFRFNWNNGSDHPSSDFTATTTWQRFSYSFLSTAGSVSFGIGQASTNSGMTILVWGGQFELGAAASTYIPTNASSVTRSADDISFTIPGGITNLAYTFDDASTQNQSVSSGAYSIPTTLNRPRVKTIVGS